MCCEAIAFFDGVFLLFYFVLFVSCFASSIVGIFIDQFAVTKPNKNIVQFYFSSLWKYHLLLIKDSVDLPNRAGNIQCHTYTIINYVPTAKVWNARVGFVVNCSLLSLYQSTLVTDKKLQEFREPPYLIIHLPNCTTYL